MTEVFSYGCPFCFQAHVRSAAPQGQRLPPDVVITYLHGIVHARRGLADVPARLAHRAGARHRGGEPRAVVRRDLGDRRVSADGPADGPAAPAAADHRGCRGASTAKHSKVTAADFLARANSPEIEAQMQRADETVAGLEDPGYAVDRRQRPLPASTSETVGSWDGIRQLVDYLVAPGAPAAETAAASEALNDRRTPLAGQPAAQLPLPRRLRGDRRGARRSIRSMPT